MRSFLIILFLLASSTIFGQKINVLFIGNSYTHYNNMPKIFERLANSKGKPVFADSIAVSGSTLKEHAQRSSTYKKLKSRHWDYIVIQGFSREFAQDSSTIATETIPYVGQILDSALKTSPCANVFFYMTWGYKNGFAEDERFNTNESMQERVQNGYLQLQRKFNYPIVPVGLVWKELHANYPTINLYQNDEQHPNINGSYTIACCFYNSFFLETARGGTPPAKVDSSYIEPILLTSYNVIHSNLKRFRIDSVQHVEPKVSPVLDFKIAETWTNIVITNKSSAASSYFWDFGDGSSSTKKNPKHYYKKPGKYTVTLTLTKDCHDYVLKKKITVSKTDKFATSDPKPKKSPHKKKKSSKK